MNSTTLAFSDFKCFCSTCDSGFYSYNKEKKHWRYSWTENAERIVVACGDLIPKKKKLHQIRQRNKLDPDNCTECGGRGYIIIGGTESEDCYCTRKKK